MAIVYNTSVVRSGLVTYLDAANMKSYPGSGTTWTNLINSTETATLINGVNYSTNNLGELIFDGVDDRGTFTSPVSASSPQTYEVWAKATRSNGDRNFGYLLHNNSVGNSLGAAYMAITYSGDSNPIGIIHAAFNGAWSTMGTGVIGSVSIPRHIVLTWDGSTQRVYVDGELKNSQALTTTPANFSTTTSIGDWRAGTFRPIIGSVYSIKIYNRALMENEIQQNYQATRTRYGV